jgi:hypothetical protein
LASSFETRAADALVRVALWNTIGIRIASSVTTGVATCGGHHFVGLREPDDLLGASVDNEVSGDADPDDVEVHQGSVGTLIVVDRLVESKAIVLSVGSEVVRHE